MQRISLLRNKRTFSLIFFLLQLAFTSVVAFLRSHHFRQHSVILPPLSQPIPASARRHLSPFVWTTVLKPPRKEKDLSHNPHNPESESILHNDLDPLNSANSSGFNDVEALQETLDMDFTLKDSEYQDLWNVTTSSVEEVANASSVTSPFSGINLTKYSTQFPTFSFDSWKNYSTYSPKSSFSTGFYNLYGHNYSDLSSSRPKNKSKSPSKSENLTLPPLLEGRIQANDTLTLSDLQEILKHNGYVRRDDLGADRFGGRVYRDKSGSTAVPPDNDSLVLDKKGRSEKGVAFPQPSLLSYKALRRSTTLVTATYGIIIASTILPNLWLMGVVFGGFYGYGISKFCEDDDASPPEGVVPNFCLESGRKLAKGALDLYDRWQGVWFLYKTGQLSYEYYKQYEALDKRFAIQDKMDAWNARFQEGKVRFDNWEKQNEVGRTILAGLRTVWLVDEQAKRRAKQTSRYRAIQYFYNVKFYVGRGWKRLVTVLGNCNSKFWGEFVSGIRQDMKFSGLDALGTRIGAVVASLLAICATGALYAISAPLLAVMAVLLGVIWPSWVAELAERMQELFDDTRARGRGDDDYVSSRKSKMNMARVLGRYDKQKYSYYKRPDGSKRYYRTGQSYIRFGTGENDLRKSMPWNTKKEEQSMNPWGIFGSFFKGSS